MGEMTRKASTVARILSAAIQGVPRKLITQNYDRHTPGILAAHGYPSVTAMKNNLDQLRRLGDLSVTFDTPENEPPVKPPPQPVTAADMVPGENACPVSECTAIFETKRALRLHNTRAHRVAS